MSKRHEFETFTRLRSVAQAELKVILKALPAEIRQAVHDTQFLFEERPAKGSPDPEAMSAAQGRIVTIYLMNLFDRYGGQPGEFRVELRKHLVEELAGQAGMEVDWGGS